MTWERDDEMPLAKDTQLQRVLDLNIEFRSNIGVTLTRDGKSIRGNLHTLAVLDTFSTPRTFEEGLDVLKSRIKGSQAWMEITYHIVHLYNTGILQSPEQRRRVLQSHHGRFESSPVHIRMLNDRSRTDSYQKAIRETVTAEDIVVDIGTGTGVLAATAAMAGAKHVYAVEAGSMGRLAQQIFDMNGLSDRITLIEGKSTQIELPEKADVMVSEIIGNDPLGENVIQTTEDAVKRLLNPGARL